MIGSPNFNPLHCISIEIPLGRDAKPLAGWFESHPEIELALVFGSVARGDATRSSDIGVAVQMATLLGADDKMQLIADIAAATGRPVDLIDLRTVGEPRLGQILTRAYADSSVAINDFTGSLAGRTVTASARRTWRR